MADNPRITTAPFGRTGHESTRVIFGAAALGRVTQAEADQTMELILEYGINHIDVAASYGEAEVRLGPWMARQRDQFFLASKTGERTYAAARDQIRRSLARLQTDRLDLIQLHNLSQPDEWETAMGPDGALKAAIEAREAGLVRFIGVTGHGVVIPAMHLRSLQRFDFDSVLLPYNYAMWQNPQYVADFEAVERLCHERNVAMQTIKAATYAPWGEKEHTRATWYEPLERQADIDTAVAWVLQRPGIFLNSVGDIHVLPKVLAAAARFVPPATAEERARLDEAAGRLGTAPLFV
jgi:aryl-alcohol dehydrogenase-like predicted oxidoreductase